MKDVMNKEIRKELISGYLNAETSSDEENLLAYYYACNKVDEDETAIAQMILLERCNVPLLSNEGIEEFDRIIREAKHTSQSIRVRWIAWASGIAATLALFFTLYSPSAPQSPFKTVEVAQKLQQMMNLEIEGIFSLTATPIDEYILLKAELQDGSVKTFIMSKDRETISLLAIN
ncbi:MAG: hypothetical protein E7095_05540 [Bacteroides sp.]|nr:hypothetical protein [Bacteroides sp.]